jgi:hypothetical protein
MRIVPYEEVTATLTAAGMRNVYYNGGSFDFVERVNVFHRGWLIEDDPTLKPAARAFCRFVEPRTVEGIADQAMALWRAAGEPVAWFMPAAHWASQLQHEARPWLGALLEQIGVSPTDVAALADCRTAPAVELAPGDAESLRRVVETVLRHADVSDFVMLWPTRQTKFLLHQHRQVFVSSADSLVFELLDDAI